MWWWRLPINTSRDYRLQCQDAAATRACCMLVTLGSSGVWGIRNLRKDMLTREKRMKKKPSKKSSICLHSPSEKPLPLTRPDDNIYILLFSYIFQAKHGRWVQILRWQCHISFFSYIQCLSCAAHLPHPHSPFFPRWERDWLKSVSLRWWTVFYMHSYRFSPTLAPSIIIIKKYSGVIFVHCSLCICAFGRVNNNCLPA